MKKLAISILCLSLSLPVLAGKQNTQEEETPKLPKGVVIEEELKVETINPVNIYKIYGSLKEIDKTKSDNMRLQGKAYVRKVKLAGFEDQVITNIQWLGVQKVDAPDKIVGFKEPIVSSFMFKEGTNVKNIPLPTFGDQRDLVRAINDLEQDKIDLEDLKRKRKFKPVYGKKDENAYWMITKRGARSIKTGSSLDNLKDENLDQDSEIGFDDNNLSSDASKERKPSSGGQSNANHEALSLNSGDNAANALPEFNASNNHAGKNKEDFKFDLKGKEANNNDEKLANDTHLTVELTEDGCNPEHDVLQERVVITARAKKIEDGKVIDEGICERTLEMYPVKKDYLCEECVDDVELEVNKAFARYQEHWFDKEGTRHNLGIKIDKGEPFDIHEEIKDCGFDTESEQGYAIQMSVLGYLNKFKGFQTLENCRTSESSKKYPVTATTKGCEILHDFPNKISYLQNRLVFTVKNAERQARGCEKVEPEIEHQFTCDRCKPLVNIDNKTFTKTAKRYVKINEKTKLITEVCEPLIEEPLKETRIGCEGKYYHDFTADKSYIKKRYYYDTDRGAKFVTGCVVTDEYLPMSTERNGKWHYNDKDKIAMPELGVFFECLEQGKTQLCEYKVREGHGFEPYVLSDTVVEHDKTIHVYGRADGTFYREEGND